MVKVPPSAGAQVAGHMVDVSGFRRTLHLRSRACGDKQQIGTKARVFNTFLINLSFLYFRHFGQNL